VSTRERILAAARQRETLPTIAELARDAGLSRATVHRHFATRAALLRALDLQPAPETRERVLSAAIELLARDGLTELSMDAVAERAGISRANLYRLFPGKPKLFTELVRVYSPLEPIGATITQLGDQPPEVVMPALARAAARHLEGRIGLVRSLLFEVSAPSAEAATARELAMQTAVVPVTAYLLAQMEAGRLRRLPPLLALQAFIGPLIAHTLLRPFAADLLGFKTPLEDAVVQLADVWLAGMRP
jgi:AcrR family transcriptional regulator